MTTTDALLDYIEGLPDGRQVLVLQRNGDKLACSPTVDADGTLVLVPEYPEDETGQAIAGGRDRVRLRSLLCDVAQLLDGWHNDGTAWTAWDESVRRGVSEELRRLDV